MGWLFARALIIGHISSKKLVCLCVLFGAQAYHALCTVAKRKDLSLYCCILLFLFFSLKKMRSVMEIMISLKTHLFLGQGCLYLSLSDFGSIVKHFLIFTSFREKKKKVKVTMVKGLLIR